MKVVDAADYLKAHWGTIVFEGVVMPQLRSRAKWACKEILGADVYDGMRRAWIPLPSIIDTAALKAFSGDMRSPAVDTLREAYRVLHTTRKLVDDE